MDNHERPLLARLEALNAARYAAFATIIPDEELDLCEARATVANQLYAEIEVVEAELERLSQ